MRKYQVFSVRSTGATLKEDVARVFVEAPQTLGIAQEKTTAQGVSYVVDFSLTAQDDEDDFFLSIHGR